MASKLGPESSLLDVPYLGTYGHRHLNSCFPGVHYPAHSLSSYNQTRKKQRSSFMNSSLVGTPCALTYPGHPPHRSWDSAIQPRSPLAFLPLVLPSVQPSTFSPSSPALQQSSLKHLDSFALCQALGIPSSCSFTGSIPEGASSPRPPTGPRTVCLHLPWWQWEVG